ncbi:hypothetical protein CEXT_366911 [Caerostris extrusa]|uniref:Ycf15 n=1 Tax=Caerostris extrusa TaxID=172846 RepID=A0AAV4W5W3_CAEEX|nr:hypothetical protein CEXT_366911 [Caerostris extrusa]
MVINYNFECCYESDSVCNKKNHYPDCGLIVAGFAARLRRPRVIREIPLSSELVEINRDQWSSPATTQLSFSRHGGPF